MAKVGALYVNGAFMINAECVVKFLNAFYDGLKPTALDMARSLTEETGADYRKMLEVINYNNGCYRRYHIDEVKAFKAWIETCKELSNEQK